MSITSVDRAALVERLSARLSVVGLIPFLLVLVVIGMALVEPRFYGLPNLFNILRNTSFLAIMACGQMLVMIGGGMDLSVGATAALASVVAAKVMASATEAYGFDPGVAMVLGILSSLGSAAAVGLLNGLCSALLRVPSLIVTLGTLSIVSGITLMMTSGMPVYGLPRGFIADFGRALWWGVPAPAYVAVAVVAVVCLVQRKTVLGTYIYA
ncbi:MAG TPA: ABC transporter permease, partial [Stellaceae bacterium]|nr:ABC transporter permease [Stellaceae bacterium]